MKVLLVLLASLCMLWGAEGLGSCGNCNGNRDDASRCPPDQLAQECRCMSGYFGFDEKKTCEEECDNTHFSLFTHGQCIDSGNSGYCTRSCGWRMRIWATVFVIIVFVAAVVLLIFILPMCITSCKSCLLINKDEKRKKRNAQIAVGDSDSRDMVPSKAGTSNPAAAGAGYNPYMYWPYGYQTQGRY